MKTNHVTNSLVAAEVTRRTYESIHQPPPVWSPAFRLFSGAQHAKAWTPNPGGYPLGLRSSTLFALTLLAATALFTHAAFAAKPPPPPPQPSSGTLVLALPDASNWGLTASPSGTIYAVGNTYTTWSQLVLGSSDSGSSWSVLDDFAPPGRHVDFFGLFDLGGGITSDPAGNLYVSGLSYPDEFSNAEAQWYVRRSTDGGATWTTVDAFVKSPVDANADDIGIAADASGNAYVSGCDFYQSGSNFSPLWTIRKGVGGTSFSTVDMLPNSRPTDVFLHPTAGIFVAGITTVTVRNQTSDA